MDTNKTEFIKLMLRLPDQEEEEQGLKLIVEEIGETPLLSNEVRTAQLGIGSGNRPLLISGKRVSSHYWISSAIDELLVSLADTLTKLQTKQAALFNSALRESEILKEVGKSFLDLEICRDVNKKIFENSHQDASIDIDLSFIHPANRRYWLHAVLEQSLCKQ